MRRIDLRAAAGAAPADYRSAVPRAEFDVEAALQVVRPICDDVRDRGVEAIVDYSARFDGVVQTDIVVPPTALRDALAALDPAVRSGLEESIARLRATCEAELAHDVVTELGPGARVTQRMVPVQRVGLYVPGGLAPLVSSVVMNVVPAQVAGVASIALTSSPQQGHGGLPHPTILAACALLGVEEVYAVGGAQAIAMFAHGAGPCRRVDLVTGPGSIYTVAAKRLLKGIVGIDAEAGPTEIAVLADDSADPAFVAADLISQAEHDPLAASVLVTPSEELADEVEAQLDKQIAVTRHVDRIRAVAHRSAVRHRPGRRPRPGTRRGQCLRRRAPRDPDPERRRGRRSGAQRGCDLRRLVRAGVAGRLLRRVQPRAAHGRLCLPQLGAVGPGVPEGGARRRLHPPGPGRRRRPRRHLADAEDLPGHGAAVRVRFEE